MTFAMLPPEINSRRMYTGPGSQPLAEAVTAWGRLAVRLHAAAADCRAVAATLRAECAGAHIDWLQAAAAGAECAAAHGRTAARAQDAALAAVVPPSMVEANRTRRTALVATNWLGQAGATIGDCEADYDGMWAQDVEAMYAYARASADASALTPFTSPPPAERPGTGASPTWALTSAPELIAAGTEVISTIHGALRALSLSPLAKVDVLLAPVTSPLSMLSSLSAPSDFAISHLNALNKAAALRCLLSTHEGDRGAPVVARLGRARSVGSLSVPRCWRATARRLALGRRTVATTATRRTAARCPRPFGTSML